MLTLLLLAIAPGLAIALYIYCKDQHEREPIGLLVKCFLLGMLSTIPAVALEYYGGSIGFYKSTGYTNSFIYAFLIVALAEEGCKYLFVYRFAYRNPQFNEPFDGIVYSVMVSMGFATAENILYVVQMGVGTGIMRMFTAVPAHATFAIIMGYFLGMAKFRPVGNGSYFFLALAGAVLFHGAYDFSLFQVANYPLAALGAIVSLVLGIYLSRKAIKISSEQSPFKNMTANPDL